MARRRGIGKRRPFPSSARQRSAHQWRKIRELVFARDGRRCATCGGYGTDIDHVLPISKGGTDALQNLRVQCARCNRSEGAKLTKRRRRRREWPGAITIR